MDAQDFSSLRRILDSQLAPAYPDWIHDGHLQSIDFDGASDQLAFLAPALETQGAGLSWYRLWLDVEIGNHALSLQTIYFIHNSPPALTTYFASGMAH